MHALKCKEIYINITIKKYKGMKIKCLHRGFRDFTLYFINK